MNKLEKNISPAEEKLLELRNNLFLEITSSSGLAYTPGTSTTIITKDKKIYYYHKYYRIPEKLKDELIPEDITEGKLITDELYNELDNYIKTIILNLDEPLKPHIIFDASFSVRCEDRCINNNTEIYRDISKILKKHGM